jgi:hypothetical protein
VKEISGSYDIDVDDEEFFSNVSPLTEASCTLQDYMTACLRYNNDLQKRLSYDDCLYDVIKERAYVIKETEH